MSINLFVNNYKQTFTTFSNNKDVAKFISTEYDKSVKLGSATGVPPAGGPSAKFLSGSIIVMTNILSAAMDTAQKLKVNLKKEDVLPPALFAYWASGGLTLTSSASGAIPPSTLKWPTLALPKIVSFDYSKADNKKNFNNMEDYINALKKFLIDWTNQTSFSFIPPSGTPITVSYKLG